MIGCALGLACGSGVAAVLLAGLGALVGHLYDELHADPGEPFNPALDAFQDIAEAPTPPRPQPRVRPRAKADQAPAPAQEEPAPLADRALAAALCPMFVEVARADGEVSREEVRAIREHFEHTLRFDARGLNVVRNHLKAAIASEPDLDRVCRRVREQLPASALPGLVDALYRVALADGALQRSEHDALRRICRALELAPEAQARIAEQHLGGGEEAFAELGLSPDATNEEVRSAYRRLAAQHHPDRVAHEGPAAVEAATRRFHRLKDAYEELRKLRGL